MDFLTWVNTLPEEIETIEKTQFKFHKANYTIKLCDLINNGFNFHWDSFPIWDEAYRPAIIKLIQDYFYTWEIGFETEYQFGVALIAKLCEVMPRLNILFKSRNLVQNPLIDHDYLEAYQDKGTKDTAQSGNEKKDSTDNRTINRTEDITTDTTIRQSDTPQQNLSNLGYGTDEEFINQWLTYGEIDNVKQHDIENTTDNDVYKHNIDTLDIEDTDTTKQYQKHNIGRGTSEQELAKQLSELAFDIETQLLNELKPLFMGLYM